ncbi:MAG: MBL fold metallo-hydrolase [Verrucomicrobiae bacterium]|nr:MBL fold metallo-hydrolase [Verrucomicrobiae bacterium]
MKITWLGQGGCLFESGGARLVVDPYLSDIVEEKEGLRRLTRPPLGVEELNPSAVICTHDHLDHLDPVAAPQIASRWPGCRFAGPSSVRQHLIELGIDGARVTELAQHGMHHEPPFQVKAVAAFHSDPHAIGLIAEAKGIRFYLSGDTLLTNGLLDELRPEAEKLDMAFICINGRLGNMNADEALEAMKVLRPRVVIPMHYGLFTENTVDPRPFLAACRAAKLRAMELPLGHPMDAREISR